MWSSNLSFEGCCVRKDRIWRIYLCGEDIGTAWYRDSADIALSPLLPFIYLSGSKERGEGCLNLSGINKFSLTCFHLPEKFFQLLLYNVTLEGSQRQIHDFAFRFGASQSVKSHKALI
jgi:hypothetical protein